MSRGVNAVNTESHRNLGCLSRRLGSPEFSGLKIDVIRSDGRRSHLVRSTDIGHPYESRSPQQRFWTYPHCQSDQRTTNDVLTAKASKEQPTTHTPPEPATDNERCPPRRREQRTTNDARSAKASNEQPTTPSPPKRATNNQRRTLRQSEQVAKQVASAQTRERSKLAPSAPKRATNNQRRPHRQSEQVAKQVASAQTRERSNTHLGQNGISSSWMPE